MDRLDKITRGSMVGRYHDKGMSAAGKPSKHTRGWSIKHLDTCPPRTKEREPQNRGTATQTFAETDTWYPTAASSRTNSKQIPFFSPRYWRDAVGRSPAKPPMREEQPDVPLSPKCMSPRAFDAGLSSEAQRRSASRNYKTSENWMGYSADVHDIQLEVGSPERPQPRPTRSTRSATSWRVNDSSLGSDGMGISAAKGTFRTPIGNAVDGKPSPGKKTFRAINEPDTARRLRQDASQPPPPARGKRLPTSSRTQSSPELQHAVSGEVANNSVGEVRYMAGDHVIGNKFGRRPAVVERGGSKAAGFNVYHTPRHQLNSDSVRQHLQPTGRAVPGPRPQQIPPTPTSAMQAQPGQFSLYGNFSTVTSSVRKGSAFLHSHVVRPVGSLRPGVFSPRRIAGMGDFIHG